MFTPAPKTPGLMLAVLPLLLALALSTVACSQDSSEGSGKDSGEVAGTAAPQREVRADWRDDRRALGRSTYEAVCAECHDTGRDDAPRTGQREDWDDRSDMWQAVLFRHAKMGYLDMPEKGGEPGLSEDAVEAAAEYMLDLTFPELPKD